jgi:hypothetical protein
MLVCGNDFNNYSTICTGTVDHFAVVLYNFTEKFKIWWRDCESLVRFISTV